MLREREHCKPGSDLPRPEIERANRPRLLSASPSEFPIGPVPRCCLASSCPAQSGVSRANFEVSTTIVSEDPRLRPCCRIRSAWQGSDGTRHCNGCGHTQPGGAFHNASRGRIEPADQRTHVVSHCNYSWFRFLKSYLPGRGSSGPILPNLAIQAAELRLPLHPTRTRALPPASKSTELQNRFLRR